MREDTIICRCGEVTYGEVVAAIQAGARDVNAVKRWTRTGMGLCQGKTCGTLVMRILSQELGVPASEQEPGSVRPPVRPIPARVLGEESPTETCE